MAQGQAKTPYYTEDTTHTSGDTGLLALAVRNDALLPIAGSNLDYIPFSTDRFGALHVSAFPVGTIDSFGHIVTGSVNNQVDIQFFRDTPANLTTVTTANGGTTGATGGMATFATTTTASSRAQGVSLTTTTYTAGAEIYAVFTAAFTGTGSGTSYHRIGLFDTSNGLFIGYEGGTFYATIRKGGADVGTAKASFSEDTLTGAATSAFTRNGVPEAINLALLNVWRIRLGWVGSAPINFEVLSPDGRWVTFHKIKQPNLVALPSLEDADLPVTCDVNSGNSGTALSILTNCWSAGTTQALARLDATLTDRTLVQTTRSVITGETTAGGGAYVNVKVDPSGALATAGTISSIVPGTAATNLGKAEDAGHTSGDVGVMALAVRNDAGTALAGTTADYIPLTTNSTGHLWVSAINGGTFAVQVDGSALTALQLIDDPVFADDAAFTVATSKVMMSGALAVAHSTNPDAADALDAVAPIANRHRVPFVIGGHPNVLLKNLNVSDADGAQTDVALVTVSAGSKIVVTHITVAVDSATTAVGGVAVRIGFGATNTPALDAAGVLLSHSGIPAGGGISLGNGGGMLGVGADGEDLRVTCEDPAGGNIDITLGYYTIES